uniref:Uncharacterized protein n=1 Tax=Zea mays TaxID=4577 RepID=A0A804MFF5_MAIZE
MTRAHLPAAAQRRPTVALLLGLALAFCLAVLSIQFSFYAAPGAPGRRLDLDADDVRDLAGFQAGGWIWTPTTCATSRGSSPASSSVWEGVEDEIDEACRRVRRTIDLPDRCELRRTSFGSWRLYRRFSFASMGAPPWGRHVRSSSLSTK